MKKIHYNKLIRDRVPSNMKKKGVQFRVTTLTAEKTKRELLRKVGEEASALPVVKDRAELISEVGDVLDVIDEIVRVNKISSKDLRTSRRSAMLKKGGFRKRYYLHWSADNGYRTNERVGNSRKAGLEKK